MVSMLRLIFEQHLIITVVFVVTIVDIQCTLIVEIAPFGWILATVRTGTQWTIVDGAWCWTFLIGHDHVHRQQNFTAQKMRKSIGSFSRCTFSKINIAFGRKALHTIILLLALTNEKNSDSFHFAWRFFFGSLQCKSVRLMLDEWFVTTDEFWCEPVAIYIRTMFLCRLRIPGQFSPIVHSIESVTCFKSPLELST